jgi:hypothetical protein
MARGVQGGYGICVCEGIIITLPAKSFGGGGFAPASCKSWPDCVWCMAKGMAYNNYYVKCV